MDPQVQIKRAGGGVAGESCALKRFSRDVEAGFLKLLGQHRACRVASLHLNVELQRVSVAIRPTSGVVTGIALAFEDSRRPSRVISRNAGGVDHPWQWFDRFRHASERP